MRNGLEKDVVYSCSAQIYTNGPKPGAGLATDPSGNVLGNIQLAFHAYFHAYLEAGLKTKDEFLRYPFRLTQSA